MTAAGVDVFELYPDLFVGIDAAVRRCIISHFGSDAHEGWEPNRSDVELLVGYATGRISKAEYLHSALAHAQHSGSKTNPSADASHSLTLSSPAK
jgi:hypothetical protein